MKGDHRLDLTRLIVKDTMANLSPNTKQMPWFPDHAPSSLSGIYSAASTRKTNGIEPKASKR
ncbi:TPA: hypothetical protein RQJ95_003138 [Vibrio vulnificus]|nr:hypothetical protein [Vibrio vulnificus]